VYAYVNWRFGQIKRVAVPSVAAVPTGQPTTILVVGSDSRAGLSGVDVTHFGSQAQNGGQRSDTIMLVHLDPRAGTASLLSIPRDLWVPIATKNYNQRINTAFDTSADLLVKTIEQSVGIPINHFVEVDFNSFRAVVNSLGGIKFWYPEPVRDTYSGLNITNPGCYTLSGDMALGLVRSRHLQYFDAGRWHDELESDLARIRRQQAFVKRIVHKAQGAGLFDLGSLNGVIGGVVNNLTVDGSFSQHDMLSLARRFRGFNTDQMVSATLPTTPQTVYVGGVANDVLLLDQAKAPAVIDAFLGATAPTAPTTTVPALDPATVSVRVLNGSGRPSEATIVTHDLAGLGFVTGSPGDAAVRTARTLIRYAPGADNAARFLQSRLVNGADLVPDPTVGNQLVLVTGHDYGGLQPTATTAGTSGAPPTTLVPAGRPLFPGAHGADPPPAGSGC